jgi:PKD repeat protein
MKTAVALVLLFVLLIGGCPQTQTTNESVVQALIAASSTSGVAPFAVTFSAGGSTTPNGGTLTYAWDFADGTTSTAADVVHLFEHAGRYVVRLVVTDETGDQGVATADIRAAGSGAVAIIKANPTNGPPPLLVQFDGTDSQASGDTVYDYYWDFGDGTQSRDAEPQHAFNTNGTHTVTLRVVSAGGIEATTTAAITVGEADVSLQFDGSSFATLPLGSAQSLTAFTLEAWVKSENEGGTVVSLGNGAVTIDLLPTTNTVRLQVKGASTTANASNLAATWRHIAVGYDGGTAATAVLYLDGVALTNAPVTGAIAADGLTIGQGFRGKLGDVRIWSEARSAPAIASSKDQRLAGTETNLLGYWQLAEGTGQVLNTRARPDADGTLGSSSAAESSDPAWSTDGPPL